MRVLAINGSPKAEGNTRQAIGIVAEQLEREGIVTEILHIGNRAIRGCIACGMCAKNRDERCVQADDGVNDAIQRMKAADGILLGSPVYYSGIAGTMKSFLDRAFYVSGSNGGLFRYKAGAALVADRRAGAMLALGQLNNYITYSEMFMPGSNYWNIMFGAAPGEALKDEEGVQTMRILGRNLAWLMKAIENGRRDLPVPERENKIRFNYIR